MTDFDVLKGEVLACADCQERFGFKPIPIIHGNENAKIFQISQAPSNNVHLTRKPFNDSTGNRLKHQWYQITDALFYDEDNFFITALSHCFPGKKKGGGDKLPPAACAKKWLHREIEAVNNRLFVIIGGKAARFFFPNQAYHDAIFADQEINGKLAIVLPHPSPLNVKWFKDHPEFEAYRLPQIRRHIWDVLAIE